MNLSEIDASKLSLIYGELCSSWRQLINVRFKLLGFLPAISLAVIVALFDSEIDFWPKLIVCIAGLVFTYSIRLYDLRNSQLHDHLISRGRKIENELDIKNGIFIGRKNSTKLLLSENREFLFGLNRIE